MIKNLKGGWLLLRVQKKAVFLTYLINLVIAAMFLPLFSSQFEQSLGHGDLGQQMVDRLDYDWFQLFQDRGSSLTATFSPSVAGIGPFLRNLKALTDGFSDVPWVLFAVGLVYLLLNTFLTAGVLATASVDPTGTSTREFLRNGAEFFGRFFRIALLAMMGYVAVIWLSNLINTAISIQVQDVGSYQSVLWWKWGQYLLMALVLAGLNIFVDYTRIITASGDRSSVFLGFFSAFWFCLGHFWRVASLYLVLVLLALLWVVTYGTIDSIVPQSGWWGIALAILVGQFYMIGRIALRYLFLTSQMQLYLAHEKLYRDEPQTAASTDRPAEPATELPIL